MVEQSPYLLKVEVLCPATATGTGKEEVAKKFVQISQRQWHSGRTLTLSSKGQRV